MKVQSKAIDRSFKLINALLITTEKDSNNLLSKDRVSSNPMGYINLDISIPSTSTKLKSFSS